MHYHLIGICGCSMSGLAKLLQAQGHKVTGSDLKTCSIVIPSEGKSRVEESLDKSDSSTELRQLADSSRNENQKNIKIYQGHLEKNITKDIDEVIYTVAVDNPTAAGFVELQKARELGIKCTPRAKFLGRIMNDKIGISVTGMHGKTTVTTMISLILEAARYNPTCLVGSEVKEWGSNVRIPISNFQFPISKNCGLKFGKLKEYFVVETDESAKQLLDFRPKIAVITNLDREHLDTYKGGMKEIQQTFKKFIRLLPANGLLVVWQEDKNLMPLTKAAKCKVKRVSINKSRRSRGSSMQKASGPWPGLVLKVPGKHNLLDATLAARVCHELGVSHKIIKKVLNNFTGAARRFEIKGEKNGVTVVDDYGHHPTEIKNAIAAVKEYIGKMSNVKFPISNQCQNPNVKSQNPKKLKSQEAKKLTKLIMIFQPHQQQRTKLLFDEFVKCFNGVDELIITDVYLIAGREKDTQENLAIKLIEEVKKQGINAKYIESANNYQSIIDYLKKNTKKGDLVITQGATDIYKVGEEFLKMQIYK